MIVDASAILAILFAEPDAPRFSAAIEAAPDTAMSALNWLEAAIALDRRGTGRQIGEFSELLEGLGTEVVPFDAAQAALARRAYATWGKGRHPASLNLADCAAYALACSRAEPLLFKGNDFALTDITSALRD